MQNGFKRVTIWLQQGQSPKAVCEIFFFLFLGYWARILLLRLFSFTAMIHAPHRQCPASCAKGLVRCSGRAFLHSVSSDLPAKVILQKSKYDQCPKTLGNLSVFPQRTIIKFGAAGVCILAGFVVKYIQSIYKQQTWMILMLIVSDALRCIWKQRKWRIFRKHKRDLRQIAAGILCGFQGCLTQNPAVLVEID